MLNILGGGPAGLAAGFYAGRAGLPFRIYEAGGAVGGNCRTLRWGDFLFDTGAHRLHDRDPQVTAEIRGLLGDDLLRVHAPSQIYWKGKLIDFPLAPYDLLRKLDWRTLGRIGAETLRRGGSRSEPRSFRDLALGTYGPTLAEMFLLNYSEKLWGAPTDRLSPRIAGQRLRNLDLRSFLVEAVGGRRRRNAHLDGSFYYPAHGIGTIFDRVAEEIGRENVSLNTRVTGLLHERGRLRKVVLDGEREIDAGTVLSTLPLPLALTMLRPRAPAELLETALSMRFRHLVLGVFLLDRPRLTENASIYFPGEEPYTRLYECKNRSPHMAPAGQTAVVLEIPCRMEDRHWTMDDAGLESELRESLAATGLLRPEEVLAFRSYRVPFAYPVLEVGFEEKARRIADYLSSFENLGLLGRSALFRYSHIHDMFSTGREAVREIAARGTGRPLARTA